jgi:hypothetical protein
MRVDEMFILSLAGLALFIFLLNLLLSTIQQWIGNEPHAADAQKGRGVEERDGRSTDTASLRPNRSCTRLAPVQRAYWRLAKTFCVALRWVLDRLAGSFVNRVRRMSVQRRHFGQESAA